MIACLFGLTACAGDKQLTDYEQRKLDAAVQKTEYQLIPLIQAVSTEPRLADELKEYTPEEVEWFVGQSFQCEVDGRAFVSALNSFASANEEIGEIVEITDSEAVIDGDQIIINVSVKGSKQDAVAEVVLSNDRFMVLEAASLNKVSTLGDSMKKAGLNTLLGMGTVFAVLILISLIIACFGIIPQIQIAFAKRKEDKATGIDNAVAQISKKEESVDVSDDLELVAVIAAAIAASEGAVSTDGFVVRSIKRRRAY